jgi:hypothetical protein
MLETLASETHLLAQFAPGDPLPKIVLPDSNGDFIDFSSQLITGGPVVFWLVGRSTDVAALPSVQEPFVALDVLFYAVLPTTIARMDGRSLSVLCDPNDALANAVGAIRPSIVIISADMRLVAVLNGDALEQTLSICREMQQRSQPEEVFAPVPVLMVRNVLEAEICRQLIDFWSVSEKQIDGVSSGRRGQHIQDQTIKNAPTYP